MIEFFQKVLLLPELAAESGRGVDELIIYIHLLMIVLFIGWLAYFAYALWRFNAKRNRKADHIGVKSHASNYIEIVVAGIEVVLLAFVAIPLWAKASDVTKIPDADGATQMHVAGQQFQWNVRYPGPDGRFGQQDMRFVNSTNLFGRDFSDPNSADDVEISPAPEIHVPVGKPVIAYITSMDVIHSFKVLAMRVTQDAIPGMRIPCWFKPTKEGRYQINCAQLCGVSHYSMSGGFLVVESQEAFEQWLETKKGGPVSFE